MLLVLEPHWAWRAAAAAVAAFSLSGFGNGTHSEGMSISKLVDRPQCIDQGFLDLWGKPAFIALSKAYHVVFKLASEKTIDNLVKST